MGDPLTYAVAHRRPVIPVLDALRIPYHVVREESRIRQSIRRCLTTMSVTNYHVAMIMGAEVCVENL